MDRRPFLVENRLTPEDERNCGSSRFRVAVPRTIGNLAIGEHPVQKPIAVAFEDVTHARDVGGIEAETQDAHV